MKNDAVKILIKNQKGGVGKSLIAFWLAHGLALENKKVLILTSDSQDNIPAFAGKGKDAKEMKRGLESWIVNGEGDILELRENLFYIPLKTTSIEEEDAFKFKTVINDIMAKRVDYIVIDASPVLNLDDLFVEVADKIVVPTYLDEVTTLGIFNLISKVGLKKIKAIMPNRTYRTSLERVYYFELFSAFEKTDIVLTEPIRHSAGVAGLVNAGKTIWETKRKEFDPVRLEFKKVLGVIK